MKKIILILIAGVVFSCGKENNDKSNDQDLVKKTFAAEDIKVKVVSAQKTDFDMELLSNGKLQSKNKAEIPFEIKERITAIYVKNGDKVKKGTILARLDNTESGRSLEKAKINLEKAKIEMQDILLGFGYKIEDSDNVPPNILKSIKIQSNYSKSLSELQEANHNHGLTIIRAPFSGIVANLEATVHNLSSTYDNTLCTLIDDRNMEVVFPILESEITRIKRGQKIEIFQFSQSDKPYEGEIVEINPVIDKDGMVTVKARVVNAAATLFDGMNIKIRIKKSIPDKIVVAKTAVLLRQDKYVVFVHKDGEAQWVYVQTGEENSNYIIINEGINEGDQVIVSGNQNLAHQSKVTLVE